MNRTPNKFLLLLIFVACLAGFAYYRGWYSLSSPGPDTGSHKVNINLTLDPDKLKSDAETVKEKTTELTGQATKEVHELSGQGKESK